jgi:hypothetical protein
LAKCCVVVTSIDEQRPHCVAYFREVATFSTLTIVQECKNTPKFL